MAFRVNPITGQLDMVGLSPSQSQNFARSLQSSGASLSYGKMNNYENKVAIATGGQWNCYRTRHANLAAAPIIAVKAVYGNWTCDTSSNPMKIEGNTGNAITIAAAFERPNPADYTDQTVPRYPFRFNGSLTKTINRYEVAETDWLYVEAGTGDIFIRTGVSVASNGQFHPSGLGVLGGTTYFPASNGEGRVTGQANQARVYDGGGGILASESQNSNTYSPVAILGLRLDGQVTNSVMLWGDSIFRGSDDYYCGNAEGGWGRRVCEAIGVPYINMCISGDTASRNADPTQTYMRRQLMGYCTTVLSEFSINDITGGVSLSAIEAAILAMAKTAMERGKRFVQALPPLAGSSTNAFEDMAGQSPTNLTVRDQLRAWLLDGSASGFIAQANAQVSYLGTYAGTVATVNPMLGVEADSTGVLTDDGKYWLPAPTGVIVSGTLSGSTNVSLQDSSQSFTPYSLRGKVMRVTSGTAIGTAQVITSHTATDLFGPVTWSTAGGTQASAGDTYEVTDALTRDGKHPSSTGAALQAAALIPTARSLLFPNG